jgi:hypothetical protein
MRPQRRVDEAVGEEGWAAGVGVGLLAAVGSTLRPGLLQASILICQLSRLRRGGVRVYVCACVYVCVFGCECPGVGVCVSGCGCAQPDDDEGLSRANHSSRAQPDAHLTPVTHTRPAFRCRSVAKGDPPWKSTRRPGWEPMSGNVSFVCLWRRRPLALRGSATVHWVIALPSS